MSLSSILGQLYSNIVPFVVLLGILVFVHELGHFLVARFCGVRVEVFSLGFGKKLLSFKKGDTTYCLSLIPLGGYVKMFGEQGGETVAEADRNVSFTHKTVWQRIAIVLAGPLMNFFFAALIFTVIAELGEETRAAVIADVEKNSIAEKMGLQPGDRVLEIEGQKIQSYEEFQKGLNANKNRPAKVVIESIDKQKKNLTLEVASTKNPNIFSSENQIGSIEGIQPLARGSQMGIVAGSMAEKAGFKIGDEVTSINDQPVTRWDDLEKFFKTSQAAPSGQAKVVVSRASADGKDRTIESIQVELAAFSKVSTLAEFGIESSELYLEQVMAGSPAELAGLQRHDRLVSINDTKLGQWEQVLNTIKSFDGKEALNVTVLREGAPLLKKITPLVTSQMTALGQEDKRFTIGIAPMVGFAQPEMTKVETSSILASVEKGFSRTWEISVMTVFSFVKLFQGEVSHKNIGGMISIGKAAKDSFEMGLQSFLMTMGILSVSLFILNLLPIPVLDGGHLVFYTIEAIKGSPLSVKKMEVAQQIGFVLLMGLMVLALFNDFTKFFFKT